MSQKGSKKMWNWVYTLKHWRRSVVNPWIINFSFFFIFKYSLLFTFPSLATTRSWGLYKRETELTKCKSTGLSFHTQSVWESELSSQKSEINTSHRSSISKWTVSYLHSTSLNPDQHNRNSILFQPEKFDSSYTRWFSALTPTATWQILCYVLNSPVKHSEQALILRCIYSSQNTKCPQDTSTKWNTASTFAVVQISKNSLKPEVAESLKT